MEKSIRVEEPITTEDVIRTKLFGGYEIKDLDRRTRSWTAVLSTERKDREGDRILASGWRLEEYKRNPVVLVGHDASLPIGKADDIWVEGNTLYYRPHLVKAGVMPVADWVFELVAGDIMRGNSPGFIPLKYEKMSDEEADSPRLWRDPLVFIEQELLEASIVTIPANPDALKRSLSRIPENCRGPFCEEYRPVRPVLGRKDLPRLADYIDSFEGVIHFDLGRANPCASSQPAEAENKSEEEIQIQPQPVSEKLASARRQDEGGENLAASIDKVIAALRDVESRLDRIESAVVELGKSADQAGKQAEDEFVEFVF
jgi:hypothetical protein